MKKLGLIIVMLFSIIALSACSNSNKTSKEQPKSESKKPIPSGYIKISDPYFKPKEQVQEEFNQLGLKVKFVVTNFDEKGESNSKKIIKGMCDQISSQPNVEYFDVDEYDNPDISYYAKKGSTVIIGYSDHDYTPKSMSGSATTSPSSNITPSSSKENSQPSTSKEAGKVSREFQNALSSANNYLDYSSFSKEGLKEQLIFEQFPEDAAQYAIDNVKVDWNEQALKTAKSYLDYSSFSNADLQDQLVYDKFTPEQAQYAINNLPE